MQTPILFIQKKIRDLSGTFRHAVLATLILGLATHCLMYTDTVFVHDAIAPFSMAEEVVRLGRWLIPPYLGLRYGLQMPWVIGLLTIAFLALTVYLLCRLFEIRSPLCIWLMSGLLVSAPYVTGIHIYFFTLDAYALAILLSTFCVYALRSRWKLWLRALAAIAALTLSLGIYQAYICWAATLMLVLLLKDLVTEDAPLRRVVLRGLGYVCILAVAAGVDLLFANLAMGVYGTTWSSYRDIDKVGQGMNLPQLWEAIKATYADVWRNLFARPYGYKPNVSNPLRAALLLLAAAGYATVLIRKKRGAGKAVLCAIVVLLLPAAMNSFQLLNSSQAPYTLMQLAYQIPFLFLVWLLDFCGQQPCERYLKVSAAWNWLVLLGLLPILLGQWILANSIYTNLKLAVDRSYAMASRLISAVESVEGYTTDTEVILVGNPRGTLKEATEGFELNNDIFPGTINWSFWSSNTLLVFLREQMGSEMQMVRNVSLEEPLAVEQFQNIPIYPNEGYVQRMGDQIVVRIGYGE